MEKPGHARSSGEERISRAALHAAYNCRRRISKHDLLELRQRFPDIRTSKWTQEEIEQLEENWQHIVEHYPEYSDPKYAFAVGHDVESKLTHEQVNEKRKRYGKFEMMARMAYGLPDRLICDIYFKCRRMFYQKGHFFSSRKSIPPELEEIIKKDLSWNESNYVTSYKYNVSPNVVRAISRHPTRLKKFSWTEAAEEDLRKAIRSIYDFEDYLDLLARNLDWKRVQSRMKCFGHVLTPQQCYNKWIRLYPGHTNYIVMSPEVAGCAKILGDGQENLAKRFRALFTLRNIVCEESIDIIGKVLLEDDSDLLKHECAYCMGQMKDPYALPYLIKAIKDETQHPMVRHEAGEALGAIGKHTDDIKQLLERYSKHTVRELSETCDLALDRLKWYDEQKKNQDGESNSPYNSVDPTPSYPSSMTLTELKDIYLDENKSLFDRYRALFTLRNIGTPEAIQVICQGFFGTPNDSALFKHEVAFVLGQIQSLDSVDSLTKKLADIDENEIVRHECAEALGSIGKSETICQYLDDKSRIVRESCQVALDMADYENDSSQFDFIEPTNRKKQQVA